MTYSAWVQNSRRLQFLQIFKMLTRIAFNAALERIAALCPHRYATESHSYLSHPSPSYVDH